MRDELVDLAKRYRTRPPAKARYLRGVGNLTDEQLAALEGRPSPAKLADALRTIQALRKLIRERREAWEEQQGLLVEPEPPTI